MDDQENVLENLPGNPQPKQAVIDRILAEIERIIDLCQQLILIIKSHPNVVNIIRWLMSKIGAIKSA